MSHIVEGPGHQLKDKMNSNYLELFQIMELTTFQIEMFEMILLVSSKIEIWNGKKLFSIEMCFFCSSMGNSPCYLL